MATNNVREGEVQSAIIKLIRSYGIFVRRINTTGIPDGKGKFRKNPSKGMFDLVACVKGLFIGIETKSVNGLLSKEQKECRDEFVASGGIYIVARHPRVVYELLTKLGVTSK